MRKRNTNIPAAYLILLENEKILLLRRLNTGYEDGNYSLIAGHVEKGETFTDCIIREAEEEAGITLKRKDLQVAHVMHRNHGADYNNQRLDVFFISTKWTGIIENKEVHKCDDLSWFDFHEIPNNIIPHVKQAIEFAFNGVSYSESGW